MKARMTELGSDVIERFEHLENGFYADLEAYYGNTKLIDDFQDVSKYFYSSSVNVDTVNVRLGNKSQLVKTSYAYAYNGVDFGNQKDFSKFENGDNVTVNDFLTLVFYCSGLVNITDVNIMFFSEGTVNAPSGTMYERNIPVNQLVAGWNFVKIKLDPTKITAVKGVRTFVRSSAAVAGQYISFQLIQLVKKDPLEDYPNPFQKFGQRDFEITDGEWFVGYEFWTLGIKPLTYAPPLNNYALTCKNNYRFGENLQIQIRETTRNNFSAFQGVHLRKDSNNYIVCFCSNGDLYLREVKNGSDSINLSKSGFSFPYGDIVSVRLELAGNKAVAYVNSKAELTMEFTLQGDYNIRFLRSAGDQPITLNSFDISISQTHAHHASMAEIAKNLSDYSDIKINSLAIGHTGYKSKVLGKNMTLVAGQNEVEIDLGSGPNQYFMGTFKITVAGSYNVGNAGGTLTKLIDITAGEFIHSQASRYIYTSEYTKAFFMISDIYLKNGRKTIKIIQHAVSKNAIYVTVEGYGIFTGLENASMGDVVASTETFVVPSMAPAETVITSGFAAGWSGEIRIRKNQEGQKTMTWLLTRNADIVATEVAFVLSEEYRPYFGAFQHIIGRRADTSAFVPNSLIGVDVVASSGNIVFSNAGVSTNVRRVVGTMSFY